MNGVTRTIRGTPGESGMGRIRTAFALAACIAAAPGTAAAAGAVAAPAKAPVPLAQAFAGGAVELSVHVVPGYGDGRKVRVAVRNRTSAPLRVGIPAGSIALEVGDPLPTLYLYSAAARTLALAPGKVADPVDLAQTGTRRALDGTFRLFVDDGKPQFRGEATLGDVPP
jgi:hypothetical protein